MKVGLYDFADNDEKLSFLSSIRRSLDDAGFKKTLLVSALYADIYSIDKLLTFPSQLPAIGVAGCLIDTYKKDGRDVLHYMNVEVIKAFAYACRQNGIFSAIAGGLSVKSSKKLADSVVDVIGFRSAVALNGRDGIGIDKTKLTAVLNIAHKKTKKIS